MIYHDDTLYDIKLECTNQNIVQIASKIEFNDVIANYIRSLNIKGDETDFINDYEVAILRDLDTVEDIYDLINLFEDYQIVDRDSNIDAYADEFNISEYAPLRYLNDYITGSPHMFFEEEDGKIVAIEEVHVYNYVFHIGEEIGIKKLKDCVKRGLYDHLVTPCELPGLESPGFWIRIIQNV